MNSPEQRPATAYALTFDVDYPDRPLDRVTSALRIFTVIPIAIVLAALGAVSASGSSRGDLLGLAASGASLLFLAPLLMIVFRGSTRAGGSTGTASCCASPTASTHTARC